MDEMNKFTMFMKYGGGNYPTLDDCFKNIQHLCKKLSKKKYSDKIEQFHIELRVDGDYLTFGDEAGCNNLRLFKKKNLIANSISFGKDIYLYKDTLESFIKSNLIKAFEQFIKRLEKEKIEINGELLINDLNKYIKEYFL